MLIYSLLTWSFFLHHKGGRGEAKQGHVEILKHSGNDTFKKAELHKLAIVTERNDER